MSNHHNDQQSSATLRAARCDALKEERTRETVLAAARGIAERTGVKLLSIQVSPEMVEVTVEGSNIVAIGLLAELRRTTEKWHLRHAEEPLWSNGPEEWESGS